MLKLEKVLSTEDKEEFWSRDILFYSTVISSIEENVLIYIKSR